MSEQKKDIGTTLPEIMQHAAATAQKPATGADPKLEADTQKRGLTPTQYRYAYDMKSMG